LVFSFNVSLKGLLFNFIVSPLLGFCNQFVVFESIMMGVFERLLSSSSLEWPEAPIHKHVVLPIFNGGVRLISLEVTVQTAY
jgi:hypothetical protein